MDQLDRNMLSDPCQCGCGRYPKQLGLTYIRGHGPGKSLADRLWSRVNKTADCWLWLGYRGSNGYGQIGRGAKHEGVALVHRVAYELEIGPIPDGMFICHHCDNPPCVRPEHLFVGSQGDNMQDAAAKGRARGVDGMANWNARLDTEQVHRIRELDASGMPRKKTALLFGITPQHVGDIARRQSRKVA